MSAETAGGRPSTRAEFEQWVLDTCRDLGLNVRDATSDFFSVGGTSLTAMRLIAAAEERFGEDALPPEDLYEHSALGEIAEVVFANSSPVPVGGPDAA